LWQKWAERGVMTQQDPNAAFASFIPPAMTGIGKKNPETLAAVQKEFLDALSKANRAWVAYLNEETTIASNFTNKVIATRSIPSAAAAYQEWVTQQMELLSKQARDALDEFQDFTKVCTNILANGQGPANT